MKRTKRILLECTGTWESDAKTGIQRVVRNIMREAPSQGRALDIETVMVFCKLNHFWRAGKKPAIITLKAQYMRFFKALYVAVRPLARKLPLATGIREDILRTGLKTLALLYNIACFPFVFTLYFQEKIVPGPDDTVLLLDSSWMYPIWPAVRIARRAGARVGLVVYDIIPLTHSDCFPRSVVDIFHAWFRQAVSHVDFIVCISKAVQRDIEWYLAQHQPQELTRIKISTFSLGCTLDTVSKNGSVGRRITDVFQRPGVYVSVGTIEPRKNYILILDAFDRVFPRCRNTTLCIVGKAGWLSGEIVRRIRAHPYFNKNIFWFQNASDDELAYCYRHARALVFASRAEGFGLPIVEALYHGLLVIASDIPVHREVGKDMCAYFDLGDPSYLANIIVDIERKGVVPAMPAGRKVSLTSWQDSCRELLSRAGEL